MIRNRNIKYFPVILAMATAFPQFVSATDTRVETLGDSGVFLEDVSNIWFYPTSLLRYPDQLILNLGGQISILTPPSVRQTISTLALPSGAVFGVAFGSAEKQVTFAPLNAEEQLHLFWSKPVGKGKYGLRLSSFGAKLRTFL